MICSHEACVRGVEPGSSQWTVSSEETHPDISEVQSQPLGTRHSWTPARGDIGTR